MGAEQDAFNRRLNGLDRTGTVGIRDFDLGVVTTLGGVEYDDPTAGATGVFIPNLPGVCAPDGKPGVPIVFAFPEDVVTDTKLPMILVRREDISPAMERWQPAGTQYRTAGLGAVPFIANLSGQLQVPGFDRAEQLAQAIPFDIMYTVQIKARFRGAKGNRNAVNALLAYVLRILPPYGKINVIDSIGDLRGYEAFNEGISNMDSVGDVQERELGFAITLRVEAELDLKDPITVKTVKVPLTVRTKQL